MCFVKSFMQFAHFITECYRFSINKGNVLIHMILFELLLVGEIGPIILVASKFRGYFGGSFLIA